MKSKITKQQIVDYFFKLYNTEEKECQEFCPFFEECANSQELSLCNLIISDPEIYNIQ